MKTPLAALVLTLIALNAHAASTCRSLSNLETDDECTSTALHAAELLNDLNYTRKIAGPYTEISVTKREGFGAVRSYEFQAYNGLGAAQMVSTYAVTVTRDVGNHRDCMVISAAFQGRRSTNPDNDAPPPVEEGHSGSAL